LPSIATLGPRVKALAPEMETLPKTCADECAVEVRTNLPALSMTLPSTYAISPPMRSSRMTIDPILKHPGLWHDTRGIPWCFASVKVTRFS
jgi:hypothetical protein